MFLKHNEQMFPETISIILWHNFRGKCFNLASETEWIALSIILPILSFRESLKNLLSTLYLVAFTVDCS